MAGHYPVCTPSLGTTALWPYSNRAVQIRLRVWSSLKCVTDQLPNFNRRGVSFLHLPFLVVNCCWVSWEDLVIGHTIDATLMQAIEKNRRYWSGCVFAPLLSGCWRCVLRAARPLEKHFATRQEPMESQTRVSKRAPRKFRDWRVQGNPPTLRQPFANPLPTFSANPLPTLSAIPSPTPSFRGPQAPV